MASRNYNYPPKEPREPHPPIPIRPAPGGRWQRILSLIAATFMLLSLVLVVAAFFIVRSARFHDYVLRTVNTQASAALNTLG